MRTGISRHRHSGARSSHTSVGASALVSHCHPWPTPPRAQQQHNGGSACIEGIYAITETQVSRHNDCAISHSNIQLEPAAKTAEPCPLFLLAPQM